jgi:hypothetical protein
MKDRGMNPTERVIRLLDELRGNRNFVALSKLKEEFQISDDRMSAYLGILECAEHPVERGYDDAGRPAVRLKYTAKTKVPITLSERYALLAARHVFDVFKHTPLYDSIQNVCNKLLGEMTPEERAHAEELGERFVYLPDGPKEYEGKAGIIAALQSAVMSHGVVRYSYESEHRVSTGLMTPFSLVVYKHGLYLAARRLKTRAQPKRLRLPDDYSDPYAKLFAVERFQSAEFLPGTAVEHPRDLRIADLFDGAFGVFVSESKQPIGVVIDFTKEKGVG